MGDALGVAMFQGFQTFEDYLRCVFLTIALVVLNERFLVVKNLAIGAKLHNEIEVTLLIIGLKVLGDVRVVQSQQHLHLVHDGGQVLC